MNTLFSITRRSSILYHTPLYVEFMSLTLVVIVLYNTHFDIFKDFVFWILFQVFLVLKLTT